MRSFGCASRSPATWKELIAGFRTHHSRALDLLCSLWWLASRLVAARSRNRIPGRIRTRGHPRITPAPTRKTLETIGPDPGTPAVPPAGPGPIYTQSPRRRVPRFALKNHLRGRLAARAVTRGRIAEPRSVGSLVVILWTQEGLLTAAAIPPVRDENSFSALFGFDREAALFASSSRKQR